MYTSTLTYYYQWQIYLVFSNEKSDNLVKLSILDYAPIYENSNGFKALQDTKQLAKYAEDLGYHRFWMAEHHNIPSLASSSPEMIMMHLADATKSIRVGSGGVMIPHYSPYKVAENFRVLETLHPGRIDLGIGSTTGTPIVNQVLNEKKNGKLGYEQSIRDVYKYLTNHDDREHRFNELTATPTSSTAPDMWILSSSTRSAKIAARNGLGLTYGLFPNTKGNKISTGIEAVKMYREEFKPSAIFQEPKVMLSIFVSVAKTTIEAERLSKALHLWLLGNDHFRQFKYYPSIETAERYVYSEEEKQHIAHNASRIVSGDIDTVKSELTYLVETFAADELLLVPHLASLDSRFEAIELLADAFKDV